MFFLVFAGNTAISKEKDTEKENVPLKTLKIVKASKWKWFLAHMQVA